MSQGNRDRSFYPNGARLAKLSSSETNPSVREAVLMPGVLTKSDVLASCVVRATKVTIPNLDVMEYVKVDVAFAPPQVPEGEYELQFDGRRMKVRNCSGRWSSEDSRAEHHTSCSSPLTSPRGDNLCWWFY